MQRPSRLSRNYVSASVRARIPLAAFVFPERRAYPLDTRTRAESAIRALRLGRIHDEADFRKVTARLKADWPEVWKSSGGVTWPAARRAKAHGTSARKTSRKRRASSL